MKTHVAVALFAVLAATLACDVSGSTSGGSSGSEPDLSGSYQVAGTNASGTSYSGEATLARTSGNDYTIGWSIASQAQTGTGTLSGKTFNVKWTAGTYSGTATYALQSDGSLKGTWTQEGASGTGTETLTPKK